MNRRSIVKLGALSALSLFSFSKSAKSEILNDEQAKVIDDRSYWVSILSQIAKPILENISKQTLRINMPMEVSPTFDGRDAGVGYLEAFGRLLAGMAPWLALPDDNSDEGRLPRKFREQALLGIQYGVDPESSDYFTWRGTSSQTLVDAAHMAQALLRAPQSL